MLKGDYILRLRALFVLKFLDKVFLFKDDIDKRICLSRYRRKASVEDSAEHERRKNEHHRNHDYRTCPQKCGKDGELLFLGEEIVSKIYYQIREHQNEGCV